MPNEAASAASFTLSLTAVDQIRSRIGRSFLDAEVADVVTVSWALTIHQLDGSPSRERPKSQSGRVQRDAPGGRGRPERRLSQMGASRLFLISEYIIGTRIVQANTSGLCTR